MFLEVSVCEQAGGAHAIMYCNIAHNAMVQRGAPSALLEWNPAAQT